MSDDFDSNFDENLFFELCRFRKTQTKSVSFNDAMNIITKTPDKYPTFCQLVDKIKKLGIGSSVESVYSVERPVTISTPAPVKIDPLKLRFREPVSDFGSFLIEIANNITKDDINEIYMVYKPCINSPADCDRIKKGVDFVLHVRQYYGLECNNIKNLYEVLDKISMRERFMTIINKWFDLQSN